MKKIEESKKVVQSKYIYLTINYGNHYKELKDFTTRNDWEIKHHWTVYVKIANSRIKPSSLIKSVEFEIGDGYGWTDIKRNYAPFTFKTTGWGTFDIPITITWQDWVDREDEEFDHELEFDGSGSHYYFNIKLSRKLYNKYIEYK